MNGKVIHISVATSLGKNKKAGEGKREIDQILRSMRVPEYRSLPPHTESEVEEKVYRIVYEYEYNQGQKNPPDVAADLKSVIPEEDRDYVRVIEN